MATAVIGKEEPSIPNPFSSNSFGRPTADRRPSYRLKSAFLGALAPGVGLRRRKRHPVGAGRPPAEGPWRPNSFGAQAERWPEAFTPIEIGLLRALSRRASAPADAEDTSRSAQADRRPKAFMPIEIGLPGRCAPGVGLRRRKRHPPGRRRPTVGRRPSRRLKSAFQGALAPGVGLRRRKRHPPGRRRPTVGRRPSRRLKSAFQGALAPGVGLRRRKRHLPGRRRPTAGRRPLEAEFIRRAGRALAGGLHAD
jgi:hypothetical protein